MSPPISEAGFDIRALSFWSRDWVSSLYFT